MANLLSWGKKVADKLVQYSSPASIALGGVNDLRKQFVDQGLANTAKGIVQPYVATGQALGDVGRVGAGWLTGNQVAQRNAQQALIPHANQSIIGAVPRLTGVLATAAAQNRLLNQGVNINAINQAANQSYASLLPNLSTSTNRGTAIRKIGGLGGEAAFQVGTLKAAGGEGSLAARALHSGTVNAIGSIPATLQGDNIRPQDFINNAKQNAAVGALMPVAFEGIKAGANLAKPVTNRINEGNQQLFGRDQQGSVQVGRGKEYWAPTKGIQAGADTMGAPYDLNRIKEYRQMLQNGQKVEPIIVQNKDGQLFVQDGKHRLAAYRQEGYQQIPVTERQNVLTGQAGFIGKADNVPQKAEVPQVKTDVGNILQGGKTRERGFVTSVKEGAKTPADLGQIDNSQYVVKSDKVRIKEARDLIKSNPAQAEQRAINPQTDADITVGNQLIDHYIASGQLDKVRELTSKMAASGTELGRAVRAFADYDKTTPQGAVRFAQSAIDRYNKSNPKNPLNLTNEDITRLTDRAKQIQSMPAGRERSIAENQLTVDVNNLIPSTIADKAITVWKAGLLTSPRTTLRNLVGNTIHGVAEVAKDPVSVLNDILLSKSTGQRSTSLTLRGEASGALKGFKAAKDLYKYGIDPNEAVTKYDVNHVTWGNNPVEQALKHYTDFVFRVMGAQDQPFYHAAFGRSIYDQALTIAKNSGKVGDKAFLQDLVNNPTEQMKTIATKEASTATFKNENTLRTVSGEFKKTLGKTQAGKIVSEVVAPFTGVPSSIAGQIVAYSPIGLAKGIAHDIKVIAQGKAKAPDPSMIPELQRKASQEIGRGTIGTGLLGIGVYLTAQGLMTGNPKDANEARQWQLEGKQANSVFINGKWRSINSVGPEALVVLAGSKIKSGLSEGQSAMQVGANIGKDFLGQTFLQGVQQPLNAIADPARYGGSYLKSQAASITPNIIKDLAKAGDSIQRKTNNVGDALKATIPGLRNSLLPVRDALGNPVKQEPTGVYAFGDLFNSKTPNNDPVVKELSRLYGQDLSATPSKLNAKQTVLGQKVQLNPQQLDQLEQATGQPIRQQFQQLMSTPEYKAASDEVKSKTLNDIIDKVRSQAKLNLIQGNNAQLDTSKLTPNQLEQYNALPADQKAQFLSSKSGVVDINKLSSAAQMTLAKDAFDKSGKNIQVIGNTVLRRNTDGTITTTTKANYEYQIGQATLTQKKASNDLNGWLKTANDQLNRIADKLKDPSTDPLEALTLQNQAQSLTDSMNKYKEYGGFTKPKKAKKAKVPKLSIPRFSGMATPKVAKTKIRTRKPAVPKFGSSRIAVPKVKTTRRKV